MAAVTSCTPCVFGAVSTSLLSFPIDIGTVQVSVVPVITVAGNGSVSTYYTTSTISPATTAVGGATPTTTITFTDTSQLTWATLGTTLTYPTTYVDYLAFEGAGVTAAGTCAQTLAPSSLTLPANAPAASLVYPLDRTGALPAGLIGYLDGAGFPAQLGGNQLQTCAGLPGALPPTGSVSSVTIPITSVAAITSTIPTTIPPPTTLTTTISSTLTGSQTVAASQAVALSTALLFNTATGNPVVISGTVTSSLTAPLAVTLAGGSTAILGKGTTSAVDITKVLSSISSSVTGQPTGTYPNGTSSATAARLPPTGATTTGPVLYTGVAVANTPALSGRFAGLLAGLGALLYL